MNRTSWWIGSLLVVLVGMMTLSAYAADKGFSGKDKDFFKEAASGGMMEVQLGQMAQTNAQSQDVKNFGSRMVEDHGKANDELKMVAQQKNMTLSTKLERKHQSMVDKMKKVSGTDFDKQYMQMMVKDHTKDVSDFQKAQQNVKDPDLNAWARKTLPVLEQHLQLAKDVARKMGADAGASGKGGKHM